MTKKLLITGANGFVGSWLVEEAISQGYHVYAGIRKTSNTQYLTDPRIHYFYYSFEKEDELRDQLLQHQFDYIILNAGVTIAKNKETYFKINAGYTRKFCKILIEEKLLPRKLVYISSLASYGPAEYQVKQVLDSESTPHPVTWYGESKLQAEQFVMNSRPINYLIFRPTAVFGPRDTEMVSVYKSVKSGLSAKVGFGAMDASFIYVKDLAKVVIDSLAASVINKSYFLSDGKIYPIEELNSNISDILGKKTFKISIPFAIMKVIAAISELYGHIRGRAPMLNRNKVKEYFARSFAIDTTDLEKDFNFAPAYDLRSGLEETIAWCKSNNLL